MDCGCTVKVILKMLVYVKLRLVGESITLITLKVQGKFTQFIMNMFGTHRKTEVPTFWMITGVQPSLCAEAMSVLGISTSQAHDLLKKRHLDRKGRKGITNVTF